MGWVWMGLGLVRDLVWLGLVWVRFGFGWGLVWGLMWFSLGCVGWDGFVFGWVWDLV